MQISPRQLVSGKLGWGWSQAAQAIAFTFFAVGCFVLAGSVGIMLQSSNSLAIAATCLGMLLAFGLSRTLAKVILHECRQNLPFSFPQPLLIAATIFWLTLMALLALQPSQSWADELIISNAKSLLASLWVVFAATLLGISTWLWLWLAKSKPDRKQDLVAADHLSVMTYSDQTVCVAPTSASQQPHQFSSLLMLMLSLYFWSMLDLPAGIKELSVISLAFVGLTGLTTWQMQLQPAQQLLYICFSGICGLETNYVINLRSFSRLEVVKLQGSDLTWMQLSGHSQEIVLPSKVLGNPINADEHLEIVQVLLNNFRLARHETNSDSLELVGILLPQGAGILAGVTFLGLSILAMLLLPVATNIPLEGAIALLGICLISPTLAKYVLQLVAPSILAPNIPAKTIHFQPWEMGAAIITAVFALHHHIGGEAILPFFVLCLTWLNFGIGACVLTFVQRTPITIQQNV